MQIHIADIQPSVRYDNIRKYFSQFGVVKSLWFRGKDGYLEYEHNGVADEVISKQHIVDGQKLNLFRNSGRIEEGYNMRYADNRYDRRDNFRRDYPLPRYSEPCRYCDKCPVHGRYGDANTRGDNYADSYGQPMRYRLVIDDLPSNCNEHEIRDFARGFRVYPSYIRITDIGNHAILEFPNYNEKEKALSALKGREFHGKMIIVRPYFTRENRRDKNNSGDNNDKLYGDLGDSDMNNSASNHNN